MQIALKPLIAEHYLGSRKDNVRQLVIETATEALSVALFEDGRLLSSHHEIAGRGHAEKLLPVIAAMENGGRADEIITDNGPGSFTGVRVGLAAARALAYAWKAPLRAYSCLSMIAAIARASGPESTKTITVTMNGGHGELFWQIFDGATLSPLSPLTSTSITQLTSELKEDQLYGTGAQALVDARGYGLAHPISPDARQWPLLPPAATGDDDSPLYGRGADAKPQPLRTANAEQSTPVHTGGPA